MNILKFLYAPVTVSILVFLYFQLKIFNLFSGVLDEGFLLYNAKLIAEGYIPYKDFFMTTTPGSFYILAFVFKIFGNYIIIDRILGIAVGIATIMICSKLFKLNVYWQYIYLISIALLSVAKRELFFIMMLFFLASLQFTFSWKG